jgi:hypothetical protein
MLAALTAGAGLSAQVPVVKETTASAREQLYRRLVQRSIQQNLSLPLSDSTEEQWITAFETLALLRYRSPWTTARLEQSFDRIPERSEAYQYALLSLISASHPSPLSAKIDQLYKGTVYPKAIAGCAALLTGQQKTDPKKISADACRRIEETGDSLTAAVLHRYLTNREQHLSRAQLRELLFHPFPGKRPVVFSLQRQNRNYPGVAIVRDTSGKFLIQKNLLFSVPQLARGLYNLPAILTNGNTPQGIFRMQGTAVSRINFIGPTPSLQLSMPAETPVGTFLGDSTITDSSWTEARYLGLLPPSCRNMKALMQTYDAGRMGRTEIIAHGTTINPEYYKGEPYYPQTPTMGCLCTKEIWNSETGARQESDQQKLVDALALAGGTDGYLVVIELDNQEAPVSITELEALIR